jgi:nitroimidazol reductase NimA-like FMN-containing flavoprotein (pyridoxamine 5'-phosphate oxidase superfamily)
MTESGPVALPVNYQWANGAVIFRTAIGSLLATHAGAQVGFEVDRIDRQQQAGCSVLASGRALVVTGPELRRLRRGELRRFSTTAGLPRTDSAAKRGSR